MNNFLKTAAIALGVSLVVVGGFFWLVGGQSVHDVAGAGITRYPNSGIVARYLKVSTATPQTAGTDGTFSIGGGTEIQKYACSSVTWNPGSLTTSTITNATSVDLAVSGVVLGDLCHASLDSATSTSLGVGCSIAANGTGTITLSNRGFTNAAIDAATGTAKFCYWH